MIILFKFLIIIASIKNGLLKIFSSIDFNEHFIKYIHEFYHSLILITINISNEFNNDNDDIIDIFGFNDKN